MKKALAKFKQDLLFGTSHMVPFIVAGGIVGNVIGFLMNVINHAPWGGWIVLPVVEGKMGYIIGTLAGALTTAVIVNILKKPVAEREAEAASDDTDVDLDMDF